MILKLFYKRLAAITLALVLLTFLLNAFTFFMHVYQFAWISLLFFATLTAITFHFSSKGAGAKNHQTFMTHVFGMMGFKVMLSFGLIAAYVLLAKPEGYYFIFPFFIHYLIFTILEISHLLKMAK